MEEQVQSFVRGHIRQALRKEDCCSFPRCDCVSSSFTTTGKVQMAVASLEGLEGATHKHRGKDHGASNA